MPLAFKAQVFKDVLKWKYSVRVDDFDIMVFWLFLLKAYMNSLYELFVYLHALLPV